MKTFVTEYGDEHGTLLKILLTLLDGPPSGGDNQLTNEVGFSVLSYVLFQVSRTSARGSTWIFSLRG
jgi:hypothetical protein